MLDTALTEQLRAHFEKVVQPVELVPSLDGSAAAAELSSLLDELAGLSDHITVVPAAGGDDDPGLRRPSFAIRRAGAPSEVAVRFSAIPLGHELSSLVLAVLWVGGHPPVVPAATVERIRALPLDEDLHLTTFLSLHCQSCPETVQSLNLLAVLHPRVHHEAVDGALFRDEVERRQVLSVPTVFAGDVQWGQGRMTVDDVLARLDVGAAARDVEAIDAKDPFDVLVVGGGPAGGAAAVYAARKGIRTGMVVERMGGQVLDTMAIENFVSVEHTEGPQLAAALERHVRSHEVDVMERQRAARLVPASSPGELATVELESGATLRARTVVVSTGAGWRDLGVPGESTYRTKGVTYCPHCDGPLFKGKRVAVIGGGNSGVEAAIDLAGVVEHATLVEFDPALRADAVLQRKLASLPNTATILHAATTEIVGDGDRVTGLRYRDRATGEERSIDVEGVFVQIGLLPSTEWLEGAVELNGRGEIVVDDRGATSAPGVFAAGDCTTVPYKQIVVAMGQGSTAALSAFDHLIRAPVPAAEPALV